MEVSLMAAVADCYHYEDREKELAYEISFPHTSRKVKFGKRWSWTRDKFSYYVLEECYPRIAYDEDSFVGILCNCKGIRLVEGKPDYIVYKTKSL